MMKHYNACADPSCDEKTVDELRNPNWIPVETLFAMPVPETGYQYEAVQVREHRL